MADRYRSNPMTERIRNGWQWEKIRRRILRRDTLCIDCLVLGYTIASSEVDHRVPLFKGGSNDDDNLAGVCHDCHTRKSAEERGYRSASRPDINGMPTNPNHHWYGR